MKLVKIQIQILWTAVALFANLSQDGFKLTLYLLQLMEIYFCSPLLVEMDTEWLENSVIHLLTWVAHLIVKIIYLVILVQEVVLYRLIPA